MTATHATRVALDIGAGDNPLYDLWKEHNPALSLGLDGPDQVKRYVEAAKTMDRARTAFAYGIPNEEALAVCASYSPLLEVGAGTGYWAACLAARGADIVATDSFPPEAGKPTNHYFEPGPLYFPVERLPVGRAVCKYPGRTLLMVWPPYDTPMAQRAIRNHRGRVIYVGEGHSGCTGSDAFHNELDGHWTTVRRVTIPQWKHIHDRLWVYERKN